MAVTLLYIRYVQRNEWTRDSSRSSNIVARLFKTAGGVDAPLTSGSGDDNGNAL
jgi:hypothetical protein